MASQQNKELNGARLLNAQTHIWNHTFSFINSMSLKSAIELNIPEIIHKHGKPMPFPLLLSSLQINRSKFQNVHRLMRLLTYSGFFSLQKLPETSEQGYVLTDSSTLLLKDHPLSATPFFLGMIDSAMKKPWYELTNWLQQNDNPSPFHMAHGKKIRKFAKADPKFNDCFNEAMASDASLVVSLAIDSCKQVFKGIKSLVDVGGGTGTTAKAIAEAFPEIECTVFDLPHVVDGLQGKDNLKFVGGNMLKAVPPSDAILMKGILHNWSDENCVKILRNCREGLVAGKGKAGKLIIIDTVLEGDEVVMMEDSNIKNNKSVENQLLVDVLLMVLYPGKGRTERELANLFGSAGFDGHKIHHVLGSRSLIEVYPRSMCSSIICDLV